jgi:hypothetical protein
MRHLEEQELLELFYGEAEAQAREHLKECERCQKRSAQLRDSLQVLREYPVPERPNSYEDEVWNRLAPALNRPQRWRRVWLMAPALAAMLIVAFAAGMLIEHNRSVRRERTRERVLLMAMSEHLERSQVLLTELLHANPARFNPEPEREQARDLLNENRLLRQSALQLGRGSQAAVLDDLERVLLSVANAPEQAGPGETRQLQERIEDDALLWKLRVAGSNARQKGQKL